MDEKRKEYPIFRGVIKHFPDAIAEVSRVSFVGNEKHNEGNPNLNWNKDVSNDHYDAMLRHLIDYANGIDYDKDGVLSISKVAWRALAQLQIELENSEPNFDPTP